MTEALSSRDYVAADVALTQIQPLLPRFPRGYYFQAVVTSRDVPLPKPHQDMLLEAARQLALTPGQLLFIGDSHLDRTAALAAGVCFAAYRNDLQADLRIASHEQLLTLFAVTA